MSIGAKFRIITVCDSYRKATYLTDGQYIEHSDNLVVNFFSEAGIYKAQLTSPVQYDKLKFPAGTSVEILEFLPQKTKIVIGEEESAVVFYVPKESLTPACLELDGDTLNMLTGILASMVTSRASDVLGEDELNILEDAILSVFAHKKRDMTIDDIHKYLMSIGEHHTKDSRSNYYLEMGYKLANRLRKYCTGGQYGHYFNGKSNVSFSKDLVVVDLTKTPQDLRKVFVLAFANIIEQEIYKGDRKTPQFCVLDESWQTLTENPYAGRFVNGLYRKARKYFASIGLATQSLHDTDENVGILKALGNVVRTQSAFRFALDDENFDFAYENKILNISKFEFEMLVKKIPKNSVPKYSEIHVTTPYGNTVIRLIVDEFMYFMNTSDPADYNYLKHYAEQFIRDGLNRNEAMSKAIDQAVGDAKKAGGIGQLREYFKSRFGTEAA